MKKLLLSVLSALSLNAYSQTNTFPSTGPAGVGTTTPAGSALFEVKSTTQGMLIPRMTKDQRDAILGPVAGLMIYQTNNNRGFYVHDGTNWVAVSGANKNLSNLAITSINKDLLPGNDDSINLGSAILRWRNMYASGGLWAASLNTTGNAAIGGTLGVTGATSLSSMTTTGNVGIGVASPIVRLDVSSPTLHTARFDGATGMYMSISEGGVYRGYLGSFAGGPTDVDFGTGTGNTAGKVHLTIQASPKVTVDEGGQMGIGTTAPIAKLHVVNSSVNQALSIISSTANGQIANIQTTTPINAGNDLLQLDLPASQGAESQFIEASLGGTTTKFAVNSDGRVGIGGIALSGVGLHVRTGTDAAPASGGYIVTGLTTGENVSIDNNEIMARNNGAAGILHLQNSGGTLALCASTGSVTVGTTTAATGYKMSVNGKIIGTEVRVATFSNWPDYVFESNYKLCSLDELEKKINANKHLPGIPAASDVKDNGFMLGGMQAKAMEKIEELTLYLIQLNKENKELRARIEKLENK